VTPRNLISIGVWAALGCGSLLSPSQRLHAQTLRHQPTPFTAWLDFTAFESGISPRLALPIWLESVQKQNTPVDAALRPSTTFRLRLRRMGALNTAIQLRLFYQDRPEADLNVSGWSETGARLYDSGPLGSGLDLPASDSLTIPVAEMDYIDVRVGGDGRNLRGALVTTLTKSEVQHALDFQSSGAVLDAFGAPPPVQPEADDIALYGRVKATIDRSVVRFDATDPKEQLFEFELEAQPLIAMVSFEVLNADPLYPMHVCMNGAPAGTVSVQLPDLADPAYSGSARPLERDMRFRYTGWLRAQLIIPGSSLQAGLNKLALQVNKQSGPVAVRSIEIQLKHNWSGFNYRLNP
jgi:hypothetical protein